MERIVYHDIYGFMPNSVIRHLSREDKMVMLCGHLTKTATEAGQFIASLVTLTLGEKFIKYVMEKALEALRADNEDGIPEEQVQELVNCIFKQFAADSNSLMEFINCYVEETGEKLDIYARDEKQPRDAKGKFIKRQK